MSKAGDTIRLPKGVVAYLRDNGNETSKLIFDDVEGDSTSNPIEWSLACSYTWRDYSDSDLNKMNLTARDYQMIGENLVMRLLALNGRIK